MLVMYAECRNFRLPVSGKGRGLFRVAVGPSLLSILKLFLLFGSCVLVEKGTRKKVVETSTLM